MPKVFLSHSSRDKESYVRIVADKLTKEMGFHNVVYDEYTFEEGMKSIEEIDRGLEKSDLFVIFISNSSLESDWVKYELDKSEKLLTREKLDRIYPIIIDKNITFDDERIPKWLREYNLKYISRPSKSVNMIIQRMREISWTIHPRIKDRENIFVGRNEYIRNFEERIDSFEKEVPSCFIFSGFKSIGRSALIRHCFKKTNIIKESYQMPIIYLNFDESLEDFIMKLYDLGFSEEIDLKYLICKTVEDKVNIAIRIIEDIQKLNEKILIRDNGCIINHKGELSKWFFDILENIKKTPKITFCIASKFKLFIEDLWKKEHIYSVHISELDKKERNGLLKRYSQFENIELEIEDIKFIGDLLYGYPEQIFFAVDIIKSKGIKYLKQNTHLLVDYNSQKVSTILINFENDKESMEFLYLLAEFDYIGYDFVFDIVGDEEKYSDKLNEFINFGICENIGATNEYIRVNDAVRNYLQRNGIKMSPIHEKAMKEKLSSFLKNTDIEEYNMPEFLFSLKKALLDGEKIDDDLIIPSLYLKTMTELYEKKRNYKEVIRFADKALENINFMDAKIIFEIRYLLCLSLAKIQSARLLEEVQYINGEDHNFLKAFYFRQIGKNDRALEELNKSLAIRSSFNKAKRELVQVFMNLQEYSKAMEYAKEHYENDKTNPYHIQAYFSCLIKSDMNIDDKRAILTELISNLDRIKSEKANEMLLRCKAQFEAFCNNNEEDALILVNKSIQDYPRLNYARIVKFDICEKFKRIDDMKDIINYLEENGSGSSSNTIVIFKSILMSIEGRSEEASRYFNTRIKNYTEQAKDRFTQRLLKYS
ncbi:MAG: TIR domain-containing protein [Paeniclostridium sordellii]|uniref:TIR domain-containing protein n=1 Tax=Paeniclostridium hominis TaxID=2764329 RepID=A0ABR7K4V3_9FIRM|nr:MULTISPECIES: toll/interleukin-1 receptor domain-containing protein [Paeniclostridium]MBC6004138.1 TIR domain-containing protein [Paeniclostridium hominis]MDU2591272.1 TIR domain-containing protein [Paeniclostridium sordellii]